MQQPPFYVLQSSSGGAAVARRQRCPCSSSREERGAAQPLPARMGVLIIQDTVPAVQDPVAALSSTRQSGCPPLSGGNPAEETPSVCRAGVPLPGCVREMCSDDADIWRFFAGLFLLQTSPFFLCLTYSSPWSVLACLSSAFIVCPSVLLSLPQTQTFPVCQADGFAICASERADRGIAEKLVGRRWGECDGSEVHVEMRFRKVVAKFVIELKIELSGMSLSEREILKLQESGRIHVFEENKN